MGRQNIWTVTPAESGHSAVHIDTSSMEELFGRSEQSRNLSVRKSFRAKSPQRGGAPEVSILDSKRSMNISIFLKQFKRPVQNILDDIKQGESAAYGAEKLTELQKLLPDKEEVKKLRGFGGDRAGLSEAELFLLLLVDMPSYAERLEAMVVREEFQPRLASLRSCLHTLTAAAHELLGCGELHTVMRLVLKAGNYMNQGGYAGSAVGFRMSSLLKLADTRANKPGMNLMHFVVMEVEKNDKKLLEFPTTLKSINEASRMSTNEVHSELQILNGKLESLRTTLSCQPDLWEQVQDFVQEAGAQLVEVEGAVAELGTVRRSLAEFLCEDEERFSMEDCCCIFNSFTHRFLRARKENEDRAELEMKRKRERDRKEQEKKEKRTSIASCSYKECPQQAASLELALLSDYSSGLWRRSLRQEGATQPGALGRSHSLKQLTRGVEEKRDTGSGLPGNEDAMHLRAMSRKVLGLQARTRDGQRAKQMAFAIHSRISEESSTATRKSLEMGAMNGGGTAGLAPRQDEPKQDEPRENRMHTLASFPKNFKASNPTPPTAPGNHSSQADLQEDSQPDLEGNAMKGLSDGLISTDGEDSQTPLSPCPKLALNEHTLTAGATASLPTSPLTSQPTSPLHSPLNFPSALSSLFSIGKSGGHPYPSSPTRKPRAKSFPFQKKRSVSLKEQPPSSPQRTPCEQQNCPITSPTCCTPTLIVGSSPCKSSAPSPAPFTLCLEREASPAPTKQSEIPSPSRRKSSLTIGFSVDKPGCRKSRRSLGLSGDQDSSADTRLSGTHQINSSPKSDSRQTANPIYSFASLFTRKPSKSSVRVQGCLEQGTEQAGGSDSVVGQGAEQGVESDSGMGHQAVSGWGQEAGQGPCLGAGQGAGSGAGQDTGQAAEKEARLKAGQSGSGSKQETISRGGFLASLFKRFSDASKTPREQPLS